MANIRRGVALAASGEVDSAARANGASIESRNGSDSAIPAPRRKWRREAAGRVQMKGAGLRWFMGGIGISRADYFVRNNSLCTNSCTRLRTPYPPALVRSRIVSIFSRSVKRTGAPVA